MIDINRTISVTRSLLFRVTLVLLLTLALTLGNASQSQAETMGGRVVVKLGTLAPKGSPWYDSLKKMGEEWKQVSNGLVQLKIYPGGVLGNELDLVRKMRQGRLSAATITSLSVREIDPALLTLQVPLLIQNENDLDRMTQKILPDITKRLEKEGFILLQNGDTGWVRFFFKEPPKTLEEMKQRKLFVAAGDPKSKQAWQQIGMHTIEINSADILPSLQTGLIDGYLATPLASLAMQWFGLASYMLEFKLAPLVGATLISKQVWDKIPSELHPKLLEIAQKYAKQDLERIRKMDQDAIETMKKHGLKTYNLDPEQEKRLRSAIQGQWSYIRKEIVPPEIFDTISTSLATSGKP